MTTLRFALLLTLLASVTAFQIVTDTRVATRLDAKKKARAFDDRKIKDAATHFGKYSVKEVEEMKNKLHQERIQSLMFDRNNAVSSEAEAEKRLMEEELNLQINLLKKENEKSVHKQELFPEVEEPMAELPHLKDNTVAAKAAVQQNIFMLEETFFEENVLETIAFCSVLAFLMIAPQIL